MDGNVLFAGLGLLGAGLLLLVVRMVLNRRTRPAAHPARRWMRAIGYLLLAAGIVLVAYLYIAAALMTPVTPV